MTNTLNQKNAKYESESNRFKNLYQTPYVKEIFGHLDAWDKVSFEDKQKVVDLMIPKICAKSEKIDVVWKI